METRSRKRIFSLVDSDIPKNISFKFQRKDTKNVEKTPNNQEDLIENEEDSTKNEEIEDYLTQYELHRINFKEFFEQTKSIKGFLYSNEYAKLNNNMYFDTPVSVKTYYYSIMNIITDNKNLVKKFNTKKELNEFLNVNKKCKYFVLCDHKNGENHDNHIHRLYHLDKNVAKAMYSCVNKNISSLISIDGFNHIFNQNEDTELNMYILRKNINIKDIYLFAYSVINTNSIYMTEKVKLIDDFYLSFNIEKNKLFTRIELYDMIVNYVEEKDLISKCNQSYIVMDTKLGNLFNINRPVHVDNFKKLMKQLIIPNDSNKIENYFVNNYFSDFKVNLSFYTSKSVKNGLYRKYDNQGKLIFETYYTNNMENGIRRKWDENGKLRCMIEYHNNKKNGNQYIFDENENIISEFKYNENNMVSYAISDKYN